MSEYIENRYWNIDRKLKNKKLRELIFSEHKIGFTIVMTVCILLDVIGLFFFLFFAIGLWGTETIDGKMVGVLGGSIFLFIFVIISEYIRNKAIRGWGSPYSEMEKEFVHLEKAGVEFAYHDVLNRYPTSMDVYEIYYEDINDLSYDPKLMLLSITGVAQLIVYDDFNGGRINHYKSQRRFYPESVYSFILATDEAEKVINEIQRGRGLA